MTCQELQPRAAGLAALSDGDAEKVAALQHASSCAACARALGEGVRVLALLDALPAPPPPTAATLQRVASAVLAEGWPESQAPARSVRARNVPARLSSAMTRAVIVAAVLAAPFVLLWLAPDEGVTGRPQWIPLALMAAAALVVLVPRKAVFPSVAGLIGASIAVALSNGATHAPVEGIGIRCFAYEVAVAALAVGGLAALVARGRALVDTRLFLVAGAAAAVAGQAALELRCPAGTMAHVLGFHAGGVLVCAALGAAVSRLPSLRRALA